MKPSGYIIILAVAFSAPAHADCQAKMTSAADDFRGQRFTCDDGTSMTYHRSPFGDNITNDTTGERYRAKGMSNIDDEYHARNGRAFGDDLQLQRDTRRGDVIKVDNDKINDGE